MPAGSCRWHCRGRTARLPRAAPVPDSGAGSGRAVSSAARLLASWAPGLTQAGKEGFLVQHEERLAFFDRAAFIVGLALQVTRDTGVNFDILRAPGRCHKGKSIGTSCRVTVMALTTCGGTAGVSAGLWQPASSRALRMQNGTTGDQRAASGRCMVRLSRTANTRRDWPHPCLACTVIKLQCGCCSG